MKYNFVYDTDFIEKNLLCLSGEECDVVFATVVGKHNAIFYGYKPERLVKAIKKLTTDYPFVEISNSSKIGDDLHNANSGILCIKDFDSWSIVDQQFLYSHTLNDSSRCTQFIATTIHNPFETVVPDVINNFDIIYMCKEDNKNTYNKTKLSVGYAYISTFHNSLHSGRFITSTQLELENYWLMDNAYENLCELRKGNASIARKVAMVARSVSDCKHHTLTDMDDISIAERLCGLSKRVDLSASSEELW
jgi:hypothetical protein